jgi:hypothetical protein
MWEWVWLLVQAAVCQYTGGMTIPKLLFVSKMM